MRSSAFPAALDEICNETSSDESLRIAHREADGIDLCVSLLFREAGALLMDVPARYRSRDHALVVPEAQWSAVYERWAGLRNSPQLPLPRMPYGLLHDVERQLVDDAWRRSVGWTAECAFSSRCDAVFLPARRRLAGPPPPDAVVFRDPQPPVSVSLKLEPTNRCNFRCRFCRGRATAQGSIDIERARHVLDAFPFLGQLELTGEGEPLLYADIVQLVEYAASRGIKIRIVSNGSLLTADVSTALILAGLNELIVSLESLNPDRFVRLRPGGCLDVALSSLKEFVSIRSSLGGTTKIGLWITLLKDTLHEVPAFERLADEIGIDEITYQLLNPMPDYVSVYDAETSRSILLPSELDRRLSEMDSLPNIRGIVGHLTSPAKNTRCNAPVEMVRISWQGDVTPCCNLQGPQFRPFGNILTSTWEEISQRSVYNTFRFATANGVRLEACAGCPVPLVDTSLPKPQPRIA